MMHYMCAVLAIYRSAVKECTPHLDLQFCLCTRNWGGGGGGGGVVMIKNKLCV